MICPVIILQNYLIMWPVFILFVLCHYLGSLLYEKKNENLEAVLYSLALNYTGIPKNESKEYDLQKDLVKSNLQSQLADSCHT